ncbi:hypothetical protein CMO84_11000 [Candidatus Woesearchaeota archaeon]|nr:hypothetical protein [Candidatus Woesearchaeota archaeon]
MGLLLTSQGKYDEAEPLYREALEAKHRTLGDEHPSTLISIGNLGNLLQAQGKYDEAESLFREALAGFRRKLGDEHPHTLKTREALEALLEKQKESKTPPTNPPDEDKGGDVQ